MEQIRLNMDQHPTELILPRIEIEPRKEKIGKVFHILRPSEEVSVIRSSWISISSRTEVEAFTLSNDERIIITERVIKTPPPNIDGILRKTKDGQLKWQYHRLIEGFNQDVESHGWSGVLDRISSQWKSLFQFKSEILNDEGRVTPGNEGLRPPQIGALHAIGAHWAINHEAGTVIMPTGTGKTEVILSATAAFYNGKVLIVVPSDILRTQTLNKLLTFGLLKKFGILSSEAKNPVVGVIDKRPKEERDLEILDKCHVVITTMSSIALGDAEPLTKNIASKIFTLVIDEAHHIGAKGWARFRKGFEDNRILQFTATPFRRDGILVDGTVLFNYPLKKAQEDKYFKKIVFRPAFETTVEESDLAIAEEGIEQLKQDISDGYEHLLMARCDSIKRAVVVHQLYEELAPEFNPVLIHSEEKETAALLQKLFSGNSRIVVCVDMLGEGFDLPELKIAAIHDLHQSLAVLMQFTGRFTRTTNKNIGDATVIANIADPSTSSALNRLYSEDADWNTVLSELSSEASQEHAELIKFLEESEPLSEETDSNIAISNQLLNPIFNTLIYKADGFNPKSFHKGLPKNMDVHKIWFHSESDTLYFVTRTHQRVKWAKSKSLQDHDWNLFIIHHDSKNNLTYLSSTFKKSMFESMAKAIGASELIHGEVIFRVLSGINRLMFHSLGVKKPGRRNLSYALYTGEEVSQALSISEKAGSVKSNLSATGWEQGEHKSIGCSYRGRVWTREASSIPNFIKWCEHVGRKVIDDTIDTSEIIDNVLIPEIATSIPTEQVLSIEWPHELLYRAEDSFEFSTATSQESALTIELAYVDTTHTSRNIDFTIKGTVIPPATFSLTLTEGGGFSVKQSSGELLSIQVGKLSMKAEEYFSSYPPQIRYINLNELDGNLLIKPKDTRDLIIDNERFETWDWRGVDIRKESIWKDGQERKDSVQWFASQYFIKGNFDIVFDDDGANEAADLVCLKEEKNHIRMALVHCKYSSGDDPGERVKDVVEVCSQAVRSAKWKTKFTELCRHIFSRDGKKIAKGRVSGFLAGDKRILKNIQQLSRFKAIRPEILIVQPGLSFQNITDEQKAVVAAAASYLKETISVDMDIICSE